MENSKFERGQFDGEQARAYHQPPMSEVIIEVREDTVNGGGSSPLHTR
jgi:hypothetical protein